jgi:ribonuclease HI
MSRRKTVLPGAGTTLASLLKYYEVSDWDHLIFSDGSGTITQKPCGWAAVIVTHKRLNPDSDKHGLLEVSGRFSHGTNNVAELLGVAFPLMLLGGNDPTLLLRNVHVFSDSQMVVDCGNGVSRRRANLPLWSAITTASSQGLNVRYHWIPRDTFAYNKLADLLAGQERTTLCM